MSIWDWNAAEWLAKRLGLNRKRRQGPFGLALRATLTGIAALATGAASGIVWGTVVGAVFLPAGVIVGVIAACVTTYMAVAAFWDWLE